MPRYTRNIILLAKTEATYGVDPVPTGAANAMLVANANLTPINEQNVDRALITGYMGSFEQLVASRFVELSFDVELVGSGTVATAPAYGPLLKACGLAETVTATFRVDYTPVSSAFGSVTLYFHDDGLLHKLTGARGDVTFKLGVNSRPMMSFKFKGLYTTTSATANPTPTYTAFKVPEAVASAYTGTLTLGATHTTGVAPTLTGGTTYPSMGLEVSLGNKVEHAPMIGGESIELSDRAASCNFQVEATAAQEVAFLGQVTANTLQTVGIAHGTVAGNKSLIFLPQVQLINPSKQELQGKRLLGLDGRLVPSLTGNDEFRLALF